jgi:hypothetical protein
MFDTENPASENKIVAFGTSSSAIKAFIPKNARMITGT